LLYIDTGTPKGNSNQASLSINCSTGTSATLQLKTNELYNIPSVPVRLKFDNGLILTETWKAEHYNMFAPDPLALIKVLSKHDSLVVTYGSISLPFDVHGLSKTIEPVSAFCGLGGASRATEMSMLPMHGKYVARLMTSDEAFAVLEPSDEVGKPQAGPDPTIADSLVVVHTYKISGQNFSIEMRRLRRDGPYMVTKITGLP
jgi:hypothetical protein